MVICLKRGEDRLHVMHLMSLPSQNPVISCRGVVGRGRGVTASPHISRQGDAYPHFFWTEIRANVSPLLQLVTY